MRNVRYFPIELRAQADGPEGVLVGYASVFDAQYRIGYGLKESITKGAFAKSLSDRDGVLPIFYEHDWDNPIGYASAKEDQKGVHVEATLFVDFNERARSVYEAAKAGALREWSIGFYPTTIRKDEEDPSLEHVEEGELVEASVVVKGANPKTEMVEVRSAACRHFKGHPLSELRELVEDAAKSRHGAGWVWLRDIDDDWVVYTVESRDSGCKLYRASYSVENGAVVLSDPIEVEEKVSFVPVKPEGDSPVLDSAWALLEQEGFRSVFRSVLVQSDNQ